MGDLLRIDLTTCTATEETLPPELIRDYIGAKGIGSHLLLEEVGPEVDPLSPQNKMFFCTGPISGTQMWGGNRYSVFFLSPLTGGYGECYSGGEVTPQFAKTGYKVVVLEGASDKPVYVEITPEGAKFHDASHLWGLGTYEAEEKMLAATGDSKAQACAIGPAGENLVRFACIENNKWHSLGRGGPGAVMGSKKVKGIVFHGDKPVEVARPDEFKALVKDMAARGKDDPGVAAYRRGGTINMVRIMNGQNAFPTRYWRKGTAEGFEALTTETMLEKFGTKNQVCRPCLLQCVKRNTVPDGRHKGLQIEGPEYETHYVFGGLCEILDFAEVMWLNDICDDMGVDTMTAGNLCALAIEASQRGLIDEKMDFGDPDAVGGFLMKMIRREGIGDVFAEGVLNVEKEIPELKGIAVHVKGMEPAGYDPRKMWGMGLGFMTATRGACHLRATFYKPELAGMVETHKTEGVAALFVDWEDRLCIMDTLVYCRFYRDLVQWPYITAVVNAAVGADYTEDDLHKIAGRIIGETKRFNDLRGFGREKEALPKWVTDTPMEDTDWTFPQEVADGLLAEYYEARGWPAPEWMTAGARAAE